VELGEELEVEIIDLSPKEEGIGPKFRGSCSICTECQTWKPRKNQNNDIDGKTAKAEMIK